MTNAVAIAQQGSNNTTFRNRIINGAMMIDQRNAGASVATSSGSGVFSVDRWYAQYSTTSKYTIQQSSTAPANFINSIVFTSSAATSVTTSAYYMFSQRIEGLNIADLAFGTANAKTVTLSFWVRSSLTGTFGGSITNDNQDRSYPFSYTISSANTWTQASVTIPGDTTGTWAKDNSCGMKVWFSLGVGSTFQGTAGAWVGAAAFSTTGETQVIATSGATLYITGVQLEAGSAASPFENRLYGTELNLCYRYYYQMSGVVNQDILVGTSCDQTTWLRYGFALPTTMRTAPSLVSAGGSAYANLISSGGRASTSISLDNTSTTNACVNLYSAGISAGTTGTFRLQSGLYLGFSAEL